MRDHDAEAREAFDLAQFSANERLGGEDKPSPAAPPSEAGREEAQADYETLIEVARYEALHGSAIGCSGLVKNLASALEAAAWRLMEQDKRIDDLEEGTWPFEWTVATAERERRKKAEDALRAAEQGRAEVEQTITSLTGKWRVAVRDLASARARIAQAAALLDDSHDGRDPFCRVCKALAALTSLRSGGGA